MNCWLHSSLEVQAVMRQHAQTINPLNSPYNLADVLFLWQQWFLAFGGHFISPPNDFTLKLILAIMDLLWL